MTRRAAAAAAAIAATLATGAGAVAPAGAPAAGGSCTPGVKTVTGGFERTFCGPAAVTVKLAGKTIKLSGGACEATSGYLAVDIGVFSSAAGSKSRPNYFGLDVGRVPGSTTAPAGKDGTYKTGIVMTMVYAGRAYSVVSGAVATLSANRTRGTVTGTTITRQAMSASFHC